MNDFADVSPRGTPAGWVRSRLLSVFPLLFALSLTADPSLYSGRTQMTYKPLVEQLYQGIGTSTEKVKTAISLLDTDQKDFLSDVLTIGFEEAGESHGLSMPDVTRRMIGILAFIAKGAGMLDDVKTAATSASISISLNGNRELSFDLADTLKAHGRFEDRLAVLIDIADDALIAGDGRDECRALLKIGSTFRSLANTPGLSNADRETARNSARDYLKQTRTKAKQRQHHDIVIRSRLLSGRILVDLADETNDNRYLLWAERVARQCEINAHQHECEYERLLCLQLLSDVDKRW